MSEEELTEEALELFRTDEIAPEAPEMINIINDADPEFPHRASIPKPGLAYWQQQGYRIDE